MKNLPFGKNAFINTLEWQNLASTDKKGDIQIGRQPNLMFEFKYNGKIYKLIFIEYSQLFYTK